MSEQAAETDALEAVAVRLRKRIAEGREDRETRREGSYSAGYLDGLKSGLAEVLWEPSPPPAPSCDCDYWHSKHRWHCASNYPPAKPNEEQR